MKKTKNSQPQHLHICLDIPIKDNSTELKNNPSCSALTAITGN